MRNRISPNLARRWSVLALVAVLGLAVTFAATSASSGASSGQAVAAKKKCKKKGKRSAASAKKKKCKKKKAVTPPAPLTRNAGVIASITWDTPDEVDLHVFDSSGNHDYYNPEDSTIPDAMDNDQEPPDGGGPETFFDSQSPSTRTFTYYVCLYGYDDEMQTSGPVHVVADITDPGNTHRSIPITLDGVDDEALVGVSPPGATPFPASGFCHTAM